MFPDKHKYRKALSSNIGNISYVYSIFHKFVGERRKKSIQYIEKGDIEVARRELSYLVSRDTGMMDEKMVIRSTMETISENTVDGIIAPMFYMFLGGLPLAMAYKAVNTLDSMVGYRNEKYIEFGKFSARTDDAANFIYLITGLLIVMASFILR